MSAIASIVAINIPLKLTVDSATAFSIVIGNTGSISGQVTVVITNNTNSDFTIRYLGTDWTVAASGGTINLDMSQVAVGVNGTRIASGTIRCPLIGTYALSVQAMHRDITTGLFTNDGTPVPLILTVVEATKSLLVPVIACVTIIASFFAGLAYAFRKRR